MEAAIRIAILDDYQQVALQFADWSGIKEKATVETFSDHLDNEDELADRLQAFQVICIMRERTPFKRSLLGRLPNLKLIVSTGQRNASLDTEACKELGIEVAMTAYFEGGAPELTWALLMALARKIPAEVENMKHGGWQTTVGTATPTPTSVS